MSVTIVVPHIRWAIRRDIQEMIKIDELAYGFYGLTEQDIVAFFRTKETIGMVAEIGIKVVGFMIYSLEKRRLNIRRMTVHSDYWRQRVGTAMVDKLKSKLSHHRRNRLIIMIRESNIKGALFLKNHDFQAQLARNEFERPKEDGYKFKWILPKLEKK